VSRATLAAVAFLAVLSTAWPSYAQEAVGLDAAAAQGSGAANNWGFAVDGRIGYRTSFPRSLAIHSVIFQFEIIGGYRQLFVDTGDLHLGRLGGGIRIGGAFAWFEPFVYGHFSAADADGNWGFLVDVGGALDWRLKTWSLGVHYAHDWLHLDMGWAELNEIGAHIEIRGFWL
jgi:hypothetical protein